MNKTATKQLIAAIIALGILPSISSSTDPNKTQAYNQSSIRRKPPVMSGYSPEIRRRLINSDTSLVITGSTGDGMDLTLIQTADKIAIDGKLNNSLVHFQVNPDSFKCMSRLIWIREASDRMKSGKYFDFNEHFPGFTYALSLKNRHIECIDCDQVADEINGNRVADTLSSIIHSTLNCY